MRALDWVPGPSSSGFWEMGAKESRTHTAGVSLVCQLEIDNSDQIVTGSTAIRSMQEKIQADKND